MRHARGVGRAGDEGAAQPGPTPDHIAAALVDEVTAAAASVLTDDEMDAVTIQFRDDDDGPAVRVRGDEDLIRRIERALYPDEAPDGPRLAVVG